MASWDRSEHTTRTVDYTIRSGSAVGELGKAWDAAEAEYRRLHGISDDEALSDDWATVHATDDGVTIRITVNEQVRAVTQ
ncbi:hypothetical protein ACFYUR_12455 [Micromonospora haikouensis]|uniref:hypothetical protein n=1 Tax=Micromonospora haikouensis TaxID=686309 RepID=UPI00367FA302